MREATRHQWISISTFMSSRFSMLSIISSSSPSVAPSAARSARRRRRAAGRSSSSSSLSRRQRTFDSLKSSLRKTHLDLVCPAGIQVHQDIYIMLFVYRTDGEYKPEFYHYDNHE